METDFIKRDSDDRLLKMQSKLTFNGIHKSYGKYDSYTSQRNELLMDKHIYLEIVVLQVSRKLMYET